MVLAILSGLTTSAGGELRRDETLLIFPALANRDAEGAGWEASLHIWVGEQEPRTLPLAALRQALGLVTELTPGESELFRQRARWFLVDNERGKVVSLRVGGQTFRVGPTGANGHANAEVRLASNLAVGAEGQPTGGVLRIARASDDAGLAAGSEVILVEGSGLSIISDLDDTLRITEVRDRAAMLRNTFLRPFRPVPGMAPLYGEWSTNRAAQFHYVSASPWQLYPALRPFLQEHGFPAGTFHLKTFRWKDESFFDLFQAPLEYKLGVIEPLLARFPGRRFWLVGDSGEADPEAYGELARRHPAQIERIFIRNVTGESAEAERYRVAFHGIARECWALFDEPGELEGP